MVDKQDGGIDKQYGGDDRQDGVHDRQDGGDDGQEGGEDKADSGVEKNSNYLGRILQTLNIRLRSTTPFLEIQDLDRLQVKQSLDFNTLIQSMEVEGLPVSSHLWFEGATIVAISFSVAQMIFDNCEDTAAGLLAKLFNNCQAKRVYIRLSSVSLESSKTAVASRSPTPPWINHKTLQDQLAAEQEELEAELDNDVYSVSGIRPARKFASNTSSITSAPGSNLSNNNRRMPGRSRKTPLVTGNAKRMTGRAKRMSVKQVRSTTPQPPVVNKPTNNRLDKVVESSTPFESGWFVRKLETLVQLSEAHKAADSEVEARGRLRVEYVDDSRVCKATDRCGGRLRVEFVDDWSVPSILNKGSIPKKTDVKTNLCEDWSQLNLGRRRRVVRNLDLPFGTVIRRTQTAGTSYHLEGERFESLEALMMKVHGPNLAESKVWFPRPQMNHKQKPVEHDQHKDTNRNKETALVCEVDVLGEKEKESGVQETKEKGNDEEEEEENDWEEEEEDKDVEIDEDDDVPLSEPEIRFFLECFPGSSSEKYGFTGNTLETRGFTGSPSFDTRGSSGSPPRKKSRRCFRKSAVLSESSDIVQNSDKKVLIGNNKNTEENFKIKCHKDVSLDELLISDDDY